MRNFKRIDSKIVHAGEPHPRIQGAVVMPVFQSAMFEYAGETDYNDLRYIRLNNTPNQVAVAAKLASLENAEAALVTSSGMAAITSTMLSFLSAGDHLLAQNNLYGGTYDFLKRDFSDLGLTYDLIDSAKPETWKSKLRPRTRAVYIETISNPLMQVPDLKAIAAFAKEHGLVSIIDNTFATPINFRPSEIGIDISVHSCTKYINGHSDIVAGAIIGPKTLVDKVLHKLNHFGGSLDPHAAFLLHRGLKTMGLRVRFQNESALKVARFLSQQPQVAKVNYPGLETHPQHAIAGELFEGFGGMLSFELKNGSEGADRFFSRAQLPISAPSLGGVETLMSMPSKTSHAGMSREDRLKEGITDGLIRISIGIEDPQDIIEDFAQALG